MRHLLLRILALHWLAVFAMLATVCVADRHVGINAPLHFLGADAASYQPSGTGTATFFASAFLLSALLFLWSFVESFVEGADRSVWPQGALRIAFAAGALSLTALLAAAALRPGGQVFLTIETLLVGTLVSYLAVCVEGWAARRKGVPGRTRRREAARRMALGAVHSTLLSRHAGPFHSMNEEPR